MLVESGGAVLVIEGAPPNPKASAGERASLDLMLSLLEQGHTVDFHAIGRAGPQDDALCDELRSLGVGITASSGTGIDGIAEALRRNTPDVAIVHRPGPALAAINALHEYPSVLRVFWGHDIHAWRLAAQNRVRSEAANHRDRLTVIAERRAWAAYDVCVYPASREADYINAHFSGARALAIPYYRLPEGDLVPAAPWEGRRGALMVGGAAHMPNRDAVEYTITQVLPLIGDVPFTVAGAWPADVAAALQGPGISFTGLVSDQRLLRLHEEHVCLLAPLRFGAGTRRKLVAAMGLGLPVVTTSERARGLLVRDATEADGVLLADTPASLASHVRRLSEDPREWLRASRLAARQVAAVYGTDAYDAGIEQVLHTGSARLDARLLGA